MLVETGGYGLMGRELAKIMDIKQLGHDQLEITDKQSVAKNIGRRDLVVHLAAFVDVVGAEEDPERAYRVNVLGADNVSARATTLYVSTDYVFDGEKGNYTTEDYPRPLNVYGATKLMGELAVLRNGGKVIRLSFKPRPYKHPKVPREMVFSGGYVDDMAQEIKKAVEHYDELPDITHVGIGRIRLVDLARQTREIEEISIKDIPVPIPRDTSFDLTVWRRICQKD